MTCVFISDNLSGGTIAGIIIVVVVVVVAIGAAGYARYRQMFCFGEYLVLGQTRGSVGGHSDEPYFNVKFTSACFLGGTLEYHYRLDYCLGKTFIAVNLSHFNLENICTFLELYLGYLNSFISASAGVVCLFVHLLG